MTQEEALKKTKDILFALIPNSTEYAMAILDATYEEDMDWFKKQLDQIIDICKDLKNNL